MAANNVNVVIGRLGYDPRLKEGQNGCFTRMRVAINTFWRDRETNEMRDRTDWITVIAYGGVAENICRHGRKGSLIATQGSFRTGLRPVLDSQGEQLLDPHSGEVVQSEATFLRAEHVQVLSQPVRRDDPPVVHEDDDEEDEAEF